MYISHWWRLWSVSTIFRVALPCEGIPLHLFLFSANLNQGIVKYITITNWSTDFAMLRENGRRTMLLNLVTWIIYLSLFPPGNPMHQLVSNLLSTVRCFVTVSGSFVCFCLKRPDSKWFEHLYQLSYSVSKGQPIWNRAVGLKKNLLL